MAPGWGLRPETRFHSGIRLNEEAKVEGEGVSVLHFPNRAGLSGCDHFLFTNA